MLEGGGCGARKREIKGRKIYRKPTAKGRSPGFKSMIWNKRKK